MEAARSAMAPGSKVLRGWFLAGLSLVRGSRSGSLSTLGRRASKPRPSPLDFADTNEHLLGQLAVGGGPRGRHRILVNRLGVRRCLGQSYATRNHSLEDLPAQMRTNVLLNLLGELRTSVEHGQQDPQHGQIGIQPALDPRDGLQHSGNALQGVILRLHRHYQVVGRTEGVQRKGTHRWRRVKDNEVEVGPYPQERLGEQLQILPRSIQLDRHTGEIHRGGKDVQVTLSNPLHRLARGNPAYEDIVDGPFRLYHAQSRAGIRLWVKVNQQDAAVGGKGSGQIDRRGGLSDPTLLIDYPYGGQATPPGALTAKRVQREASPISAGSTISKP